MTTAKIRRRMPRWHLVYLALAAVNLLTILLSITITHNLMSLYGRTVEQNAEWAGRVADIGELGDLVQSVRAPVSNVFSTADIAGERLRSERALGQFNVHLDGLREDIVARATPDETARLAEALDTADMAMQEMAAEIVLVFDALGKNETNAAVERLGAMNSAHGHLLQDISTARKVAQEVQAQFPARQIAMARDLQVLEFLAGGVVLLIVIGAAVYGHRLGRMVRQQSLDIEQARAAAEAANQAKSNFLASMSHEIRTPMNGILGMAQSLKTADLPPAEHEKVSIVLDSASSLLGVLNDVLDFSKIEAGKFDIAPSPNDIVHTADRVVRLFETRARDKDIAIQLTHDADLPRNLVCDAERVRQCISNLVSNALKFTHAGRIDVHISWRGTSDTEALVFISVKDTGIGMSADVLSRLFTPFTQADSSIARRYGGTGLGLAISARLAHLMGGGIAVESAPDAGSRFVLTFRAEVLQVRDAVAPTPELLATPAPRDLRGCRILLTDDNAINRQVVKLFLAPHGCQITEAVNGQDALDKLAAAEFDLLLLDVHMPVLDGKETIKRIRASDAAWSAIPVIALTADAMTGDRERLIELGMSDYLSKPVDQNALVAMIRALLHMSRQEMAAA